MRNARVFLSVGVCVRARVRVCVYVLVSVCGCVFLRGGVVACRFPV